VNKRLLQHADELQQRKADLLALSMHPHLAEAVSLILPPWQELIKCTRF
jgi:hypothetical protein